MCSLHGGLIASITFRSRPSLELQAYRLRGRKTQHMFSVGHATAFYNNIASAKTTGLFHPQREQLV